MFQTRKTPSHTCTKTADNISRSEIDITKEFNAIDCKVVLWFNRLASNRKIQKTRWFRFFNWKMNKVLTVFGGFEQVMILFESILKLS